MNPGDGPQLRDIHLPPDPGWWPPAPGWWLLALLLLVLALFAFRRARRALRVRRWRRHVFGELDRLVAAHAAQPDPARFAGEVSRLLRRAALRLDPRAAALRGDAWLDFLDGRLPHAHGAGFRGELASALADAPYRPAHDPALQSMDANALAARARAWLAAAAREFAHA
jgi:hypothetical protein